MLRRVKRTNLKKASLGGFEPPSLGISVDDCSGGFPSLLVCAEAKYAIRVTPQALNKKKALAVLKSFGE